MCFFRHGPSFAQETKDTPVRNCKNMVLAFYNYAKAKDYINAYEPWLESFKKCPASSKVIYKYGLKIVEDRYQKSLGTQKKIESALIDSIYAQRVQYFPDNLGKVYSDWATSLENRGASKKQVFKQLELAFQADPAQMSIKNIAKYFQHISNTNKDLSVQRVFDTYDIALEAVNEKIERHSKSLDGLKAKKARGELLSKKETLLFKNNEVNLRGLGQIEGVLDMILHRGTTVSCERLLPLYKKGLDAHITDVKWLRRALFRLSKNECANSTIFNKIREAYWKADTSPSGIISINDRERAILMENDPYKRAEYYYRIAYSLRRKSKSQSRSYAYKALKERPSLGKAYLLIANLYAASANACGTDEFSKRMVFVAAADMAKKAKEVDPSITSRANKYIKSYLGNAPRRRGGFPGGIVNKDTEFEIKCWIGETVKIP